MRGTPRGCEERANRCRIIPASAGNTVRETVVRDRIADHPRECEEHESPDWILRGVVGSSPRVRGTRVQELQVREAHRIIPASAGNTNDRLLTRRQYPDHPRECGEHGGTWTTLRSPAGSSPRVRGTPLPVHRKRLSRRIIPASAGNTRDRNRLRRRISDHPRECGEHSVRLECRSLDPGSSPRVRGTRLSRRSVKDRTRIIPASAGNTARSSSVLNASTDHPRECGEHNFRIWDDLAFTGSSPRVRGTHEKQDPAQHHRRIIPASAGNTLFLGECRIGIADHPRECGEHISSEGVGVSLSSPVQN